MRNTILALTLTSLLSAGNAIAAEAPVVDVYKSPTCGCCSRWVDHMRANGFNVRAIDVPDVGAVRRKVGMPAALSGCHTALVGGYVIEGHVPAADVKRLLREKPKAIGLAVPDMPGGSPGMENHHAVPYETLLVTRDNLQSFARH
jgi:hypothetical protein